MADFKSIKDIIKGRCEKPVNSKASGKLISEETPVVRVNPHISREYQDYGCRLAEELNDYKHKALYIKMAKTLPRAVLEKAKSSIIDYPNTDKKGALFMWKLKELNGGKIPLPKSEKKQKKKKPEQTKLF